MTTTLRHLRSVLIAAVLIATLGACLPLTSQEQYMTDQINAVRSANGRATLASDDALIEKARGWANTLAAQDYLAHSVITDGIASWSKLGETVGSGSTLDAIHGALVASPPHLAIMLDPDFTHVGVGTAVSASGLIYVVEVFWRA